MSERQEIYRYAVDKEYAMQQHNMANGVFDSVRPHLAGAAQEISRKTPAFLTTLQAFLATPNDPTGLTLYNLRELTRDLQRNFEELSGLLAQLVAEQEEPT